MYNTRWVAPAAEKQTLLDIVQEGTRCLYQISGTDNMLRYRGNTMSVWNACNRHGWMGVKSRFIYSLSLSPLYNRKKVGLLTHFHSRRDMNVKSQVTYSPSLLTTVYTCPCLCASFYIAVRVLHHCTGLISLYRFFILLYKFYIVVPVLYRCAGFRHLEFSFYVMYRYYYECNC